MVPFFRLGVTSCLCHLNRVLDVRRNQLFELFRLFELLEVKILRDLHMWMLSHHNDCFVPLRMEALHCPVRVADLEVIVGDPCDVSPCPEPL